MTASDATTRSPGVGAALLSGSRLVSRGTRYLLLAYACNLLLAMPLALALMAAIRSSLGSSLAGERMLAGFDSPWFNSFSAQATGVAATLRPSVVGVGAVFDALDAYLAGFDRLVATGLASGLLPVGALYLLLWSFLSGGFLARYTAADPPSSFLRDAARWFPRVFGVTLVAGVFYVALLGYVRPLLDIGVYLATRDTIDERVHFAWTLGAYVGLWVVVWTGNLVFDYAKVALVRDGSRAGWRAVVRALGGGARFVLRHPLKTAGLDVATGVIGVAVVLVHWVLAPGAETASPVTILGGFALGQLFIFSRISDALPVLRLGGGHVQRVPAKGGAGRGRRRAAMKTRWAAALAAFAAAAAGISAGAGVQPGTEDVRARYEKREVDDPDAGRDQAVHHHLLAAGYDAALPVPHGSNRRTASRRTVPTTTARCSGPTAAFTSEGYIFVYQDARGRFKSEGTFIHHVPLGSGASGPTRAPTPRTPSSGC